MITGFNTDVPYDGVTYHVQTEDKGLDTPLILSLVYIGGTIIASKRTPYADLISKGFDVQTLTERLQRQHKLICAAIKSGRVEDLKRMGGQGGGAAQPEAETNGAPATARKAGGQRKKKSDAPAPTPKEAAAPLVEEAAPPVSEAAPPVKEPAPPPPVPVPAAAQTVEPPVPKGKKSEPEIDILTSLADEINALGAYPFDAPRRPPDAPATEPPAPPALNQEPAAPVPVEPLVEAVVVEEPEDLSDEIHLSLLDDEGEFRSGQLVTIKIYVGRGTYGQKPVRQAALTVKVLGTSFRPIIVTALTDDHGVGVVRALLPRFSSGRAAIIIRAAAGEDAAEMRRIIHQ